LLIIVTISYCVVLSSSILERRPQRRIFGIVSLGLIFSLFTAEFVVIVIQLTRYDLFPPMLIGLLFAPVVEETMKLLTICCAGWFLQGTISKFEMIRLGGGIGLGFGSLETFQYITLGIDLRTVVMRFAATSPLHIGSCFLISTSLTERQYWLFPMAILVHSFFNYLSTLVFLLQAALALGVFLFLYYLGEDDYAQIKEASRMLRIP
jgi:RsiW-degrading membrane proteinase PrsW (M82 family)